MPGELRTLQRRCHWDQTHGAQEKEEQHRWEGGKAQDALRVMECGVPVR